MPILGVTASQLVMGNPAYESISTVTVGSGGTSVITFSSIPSTYKHLQIRALCQTDRTTYPFDDVYVTINGDTGANYFNHSLKGNGSSTSSSSAGNQFGLQISTPTAGVFTPILWDILDYSNTNKYKTSRFLNGTDTNSDGFVWFGSSLWKNTAAITSISFNSQWGTGWTQHTKFALYGIKG